MSKKTKLIGIQSKFESRHPVVPGSSFDTFLRGLCASVSDQPVRPVVTRSGRRARGHCPARKVIGRANFESLLEQRVWSILDTSSYVRSFVTHPVVLQLSDHDQKTFRYTPDAVVRIGGSHNERGLVLEVKARYFLTKTSTCDRLLRITNALKLRGLHYALILDTDLEEGFLKSLETLWDKRPATGRWNPRHDPDTWDPRGNVIVPDEVEAAWRQAKADCDALLQKVMQRDPGDVDGLLQAA